MDDREWQARRTSFGAGVEGYERSRPGYPAEAVRWALGDRPRSVLDLGAGTGKLTRVLLACGHEVVAVEPDDAMRAALAAALPDVPVLAGSAEAIPLADDSVDAVVAGQAYHWFEPEPAHREIARVLRPGGVVAPMWNVRDDSVPWVAALGRVLSREDAWSAWREEQRPGFGPEFGPTARAEFPHAQTLDLDGLVGLVGSRSYVLTLPDEEQRRIADQVVDLARNHPDLAGTREYVLPYRTVVYRAARR